MNIIDIIFISSNSSVIKLGFYHYKIKNVNFLLLEDSFVYVTSRLDISVNNVIFSSFNNGFLEISPIRIRASVLL